jgi:hypothetical protein
MRALQKLVDRILRRVRPRRTRKRKRITVQYLILQCMAFIAVPLIALTSTPIHS